MLKLGCHSLNHSQSPKVPCLSTEAVETSGHITLEINLVYEKQSSSSVGTILIFKMLRTGWVKIGPFHVVTQKFSRLPSHSIP
jgi:hypothetical protein